MSITQAFLMVAIVFSSVMFGVTSVTNFDSNYKLGVQANKLTAECEKPLKRNQNCKLIDVVDEGYE